MNFMLRTKDTGQPNIFRILARGFVIVGGLFWTVMFFASNTVESYSNLDSYTLPEVARAAEWALIPLGIAVAVFALGFFYERLAGSVLLVMAVGMLGWGLVMNPTAGPGVWITAVGVLVVPTAISGVLYVLAGGKQESQGSTADVAAA